MNIDFLLLPKGHTHLEKKPVSKAVFNAKPLSPKAKYLCVFPDTLLLMGEWAQICEILEFVKTYEANERKIWEKI